MSTPSLMQLKRLTKKLKRKRVNRVYYDNKFQAKPLIEIGVVTDKNKNAFDLVGMEPNTNEWIRYYGVNEKATFFDLTLSINCLFTNTQKPKDELSLRLANVKFLYEDRTNKRRYIYEHEEIIDYGKLRNQMDFEATNTYKIGAISIIITVPYSLHRIIFNGMIMRQKFGGWDRIKRKREIVYAIMDMSTHPFMDKFDYTYKFSSKYLAKALRKSITNSDDPNRLVKLGLEDRIDTGFYFRCELDLFENANIIGNTSKSSSISLTNYSTTPTTHICENFWGAKCKRRYKPPLLINDQLSLSNTHQPIESLLVWSNLGCIVHLNRPVDDVNFVYGWVHCGFDYASYLYGATLTLPDSPTMMGDFDQLSSFARIPSGTKMTLRVFKHKYIELVFREKVNKYQDSPFAIEINGIVGLAFNRCDNPLELARQVQSKLWVMNIQDRHLTSRISSEALLGAKGHSLVNLNMLISRANDSTHQQQQSNHLINPADQTPNATTNLNVPRGVIITCLAYQIWLQTNPIISDTITKLDNTRKALSARSFYVNQLSEKYLSAEQHQETLRKICHETNHILLNICSLPEVIKHQLYSKLCTVFDPNELRADSPSAKMFAIRSSAVGEDGAEISAAGQMKTFLGLRGFESICQKIIACWASQFEYEAVRYKAENSLHFNWPMSVIVQELIHCDAAGVATTCHPIDGRPMHLEINANRGLGVASISGKSTDTIRIKLDKVLNWDQASHSFVGSLSEEDLAGHDVVEKIITGNDELTPVCCLSNRHIVALGNLLMWLRECDQSKERLIEWGITGGAASGKQRRHRPFLKVNRYDHNEEDDEFNDAQSVYSSTKSTQSKLLALDDDSLAGDNDSKNNNQLNGAANYDQQFDENESDCDNFGDGDYDAYDGYSWHSNGKFTIHLFQSRPMARLNRPNKRVVAHELDTGVNCATDILSRTTLGEVLPGCISPLFATHHIHTTLLLTQDKPFEKNHTMNSYSGGSSNMCSMILTYLITNCDACNRMLTVTEEFENCIEIFGGYEKNEVFNYEIQKTFRRVRYHPLFKKHWGTWTLMYNDFGYMDLKDKMNVRQMESKSFLEDVSTIDVAINQHLNKPSANSSTSYNKLLTHPEETKIDYFDSETHRENTYLYDYDNGNNHGINGRRKSKQHEAAKKRSLINANDSSTILNAGVDNNLVNLSQTNSQVSLEFTDKPVIELAKNMRQRSIKLFKRLVEKTPLIQSNYDNHIMSTIVSLCYNTLCLYLMGKQEFYLSIADEAERKNVILNDFSVFLRALKSGSGQTDSGDIGHVLDKIIKCMAKEGKIFLDFQEMSIKDLYDNLSNLNNQDESAKTFRLFMSKFGHRSFKEFEYASHTWNDDPTFILEALSHRLKLHQTANYSSENSFDDEGTGSNHKRDLYGSKKPKVPDIVRETAFERIITRITNQRCIIEKFIIPRAQNSVARRERTKSTLIKSIDIYRKGFRSLAALLCLEGRLPSVNLIYFFTIDELNDIVMACNEKRSQMARLISKARWRKHIYDSLENVILPDPTINIANLRLLIDDILDGRLDSNGADVSSKQIPELTINGSGPEPSSNIVRGIISCNGIVTGRAYVVDGLDKMHLLRLNDILITKWMDISWSVYFYSISGIVTELGGLVSDGAVLAREYGIPTLCEAVGASQVFKTGQIITLDANKGICYSASTNLQQN